MKVIEDNSRFGTINNSVILLYKQNSQRKTLLCTYVNIEIERQVYEMQFICTRYDFDAVHIHAVTHLNSLYSNTQTEVCSTSAERKHHRLRMKRTQFIGGGEAVGQCWR